MRFDSSASWVFPYSSPAQATRSCGMNWSLGHCGARSAIQHLSLSSLLSLAGLKRVRWACFLHLPARQFSRPQHAWGATATAFSRGQPRMIPRGPPGLRRAPQGWCCGEARGVRAGRCLAPSLPDVGRGRSPRPIIHVPQSLRRSCLGP